MSADEIEAAAASGSIEVRCEFCGTHYEFDPAEFRSAAS
jgi:molecular chaperone Hsp33